MISQPPLIHLDKVCKTYSMRGGDVHALRDVSLSIDKGQFVSIVGTSGSGKSTLLYVIGTLAESTGGTYQFRSHDVSAMSDIERAELRGTDIGFVFQSFHLIPQMDVVANVLMSARYVQGTNRRRMKKRAIELIERVGLGHRMRHRPIELSNGEMQRVAIARALLTNPSVLLADEPTGNLDEQNRDEIFELLRSLHADGTTVLVVTHDLQLAGRCPRTIRLRDGQLQDEPSHGQRSNDGPPSDGLPRDGPPSDGLSQDGPSQDEEDQR